MKKIFRLTVLVIGLGNVCLLAGNVNSKKTDFPKIHICDNLTCVREVAVDVAVESYSVPTAVSIVSFAGGTASTGTSIASLSGAAATSSTLALIGTSVTGFLGVTVASPVIVGGVTVLAIGTGVSSLINYFLDD